MDSENKVCPYCGQQIKTVAKKCRFCGRWLNDPAKPSVSNVQQQNKTIAQKSNLVKYIILGVAVVAIIVVAYFFLSKSDSPASSDGTYTQPVEDETIELIEEVQEDQIAPTDAEPEDDFEPEFILAHDENGVGKWVKNPYYHGGTGKGKYGYGDR